MCDKGGDTPPLLLGRSCRLSLDRPLIMGIMNLTPDSFYDGGRFTDLDAVFITNAMGNTGDLEQIKTICDSKGILFIEDSCEALGTELNTDKAGNFGIASTFSFFVAHHMSTIEGGMCCTDEPELGE